MIQTNKPLHFIGFGGAGTNMVMGLQKMGLPAQYTCISIPQRQKEMDPAIQFISYLPPGVRRVTKTGKVFYSPEMRAPLVVPSNVYELFEPNNHFVIIAGLGGYTGTYMWKHFVKWLTAKQKSFSAIGTLPFSFERKNTQTIVARIQKKMEGKDNCRFIALDTYKENFGDKPLTELFEQVNKDIYSSFKI
ncbi:MAG: hypothetical protein Q8R57_07550 [Bacteroidota bacterium]|nr:hypothetical protein [Bacteroidota bacterium]